MTRHTYIYQGRAFPWVVNPKCRPGTVYFMGGRFISAKPPADTTPAEMAYARARLARLHPTPCTICEYPIGDTLDYRMLGGTHNVASLCEVCLNEILDILVARFGPIGPGWPDTLEAAL